MEQRFETVVKDKNLTAREYFYVLRLAIYHIDGKQLESSYEVAVYAKSEEVYRQAVKIAKALND